MILDITFCPFDKECSRGETCERAYTRLREREVFVPVSVFAEKPDCFEEKDG